MIEEMYKQETKIQDDQNPEPTNYQIHAVDQKPIQGYYSSSTANVSTSTGAHNAAVGGGGKVSLTLGLQQNGHEPTSIAVMQSPLLSRDDNFDEGQHGHFTILGDVDGLPYRNLIDADQLLHDLA